MTQVKLMCHAGMIFMYDTQQVGADFHFFEHKKNKKQNQPLMYCCKYVWHLPPYHFSSSENCCAPTLLVPATSPSCLPKGSESARGCAVDFLERNTLSLQLMRDAHEKSGQPTQQEVLRRTLFSMMAHSGGCVQFYHIRFSAHSNTFFITK